MELLLDRPTDGPATVSPRRRRLIVYAGAEAGLGHLHDTIVVLRRLAAADGALSMLLLTALPVEPYFTLPPRCDTVRLPSRGERVAELRRTVSFVAARAFCPDAALIATLPPGAELDSTLFTLRRAGCRLVLGLQDADRLLPASALRTVAYA